ncbi:nuclear transport factor 2 family protein [Sphingomonas sp. CJ20]
MLALALALAAAPDRSPRDTVLAMFDAFNRHDAVALARLYAPDARLSSPDYCTPRTGADVARSYGALFAAFPDIHDSVETMVVEGDTVAVRFTATSRTGGLSLPVQAMLRVRDGRIVSDDAVFDAGGRPCEP